VTFRLLACQFKLSARSAVRFPSGMAGNVLRGTLGRALREIASAEEYARMFEPKSSDGPSGLANRPRPFVFRCASLGGRDVSPGETFCFGLNIFDGSSDPYERAFAHWANVVSIDCSPVTIDLCLPRDRVHRIRVEFLTPTDLKGGDPDDFRLLLSRVRDRISTLRALYGDGPLEIDFRAIAERARLVTTIQRDLRLVTIQRRSARTGQIHDIGGLAGFADYEGNLAEFLPYLEAASWTGVGRHSTWGNGQIVVSAIPRPS
jgi:hypothetical protein